jgi:hypothetical protein
LSYFEAVNKETLKNAWHRFEEEGIIIVVGKSQNPKLEPRARLSPNWAPHRDPKTGHIVAEGRLWDFVSKISESRREGKNRREAETVKTRVLRLTETIGENLFADATAEASLSDEDKTLLMKQQKRRQALHTRAQL